MTAYEPKMAKKLNSLPTAVNHYIAQIYYTDYKSDFIVTNKILWPLDDFLKMIIYILSIVEFPLKIQNISNYFIVILTQEGLYYFILLCFEIGG